MNLILHYRTDFEKRVKCQVINKKSEQLFEARFNPSTVYLNHDLDLDLKDKSNKKTSVTCIAEETYPEPIFEWIINDKSRTGSTKVVVLGDKTYKSTIELEVNRDDPKTNVTCEAYHQGLLPKKQDSKIIEATFYPFDMNPTKFFSLSPGYSTSIALSFKANPKPEHVSLRFGQEVNLTSHNVTLNKDFQYDLTLEFDLTEDMIEEDGTLELDQSSIGITLYDLSKEDLYERAQFKKSMIGVGVAIGLILCVMFYIFTVRHRGSGLISTSSKIVFWFRNRFADID